MTCVRGALTVPSPDSLCSGCATDIDLTEDISSLLDIGRTIQRVQASVQVGSRATIRLVDGDTWVGTVTITRQEGEDTYLAKGIVFQNDRSISLEFVGDADGPVGLPIYAPNGRIWTDDEDSEHGNHVRAAFYADGPGWTGDNAPKIKPVFPCASTRAAARLTSQASKVEMKWGEHAAKVPTEKGMQWFTAKDLLKAGPETDIWPRKMPLPARPEREESTKPRQNQARNGVHKRNKATGEIVPV